jgi:hypothetical protein
MRMWHLGDPSIFSTLACGKKKIICGGSALELGARRIVDSVLPRPDARTVGPATQGLQRARKQIGVPGLRIATVNNYRNHHGHRVHRPCISNSRRNLERNHGLLCATHEASVSLMHLRAELLLHHHHNRKPFHQVPKAEMLLP